MRIKIATAWKKAFRVGAFALICMAVVAPAWAELRTIRPAPTQVSICE
jgi:hypothetical protein